MLSLKESPQRLLTTYTKGNVVTAVQEPTGHLSNQIIHVDVTNQQRDKLASQLPKSCAQPQPHSRGLLAPKCTT